MNNASCIPRKTRVCPPWHLWRSVANKKHVVTDSLYFFSRSSGGFVSWERTNTFVTSKLFAQNLAALLFSCPANTQAVTAEYHQSVPGRDWSQEQPTRVNATLLGEPSWLHYAFLVCLGTSQSSCALMSSRLIGTKFSGSMPFARSSLRAWAGTSLTFFSGAMDNSVLELADHEHPLPNPPTHLDAWNRKGEAIPWTRRRHVVNRGSGTPALEARQRTGVPSPRWPRGVGLACTRAKAIWDLWHRGLLCGIPIIRISYRLMHVLRPPS